MKLPRSFISTLTSSPVNFLISHISYLIFQRGTSCCTCGIVGEYSFKDMDSVLFIYLTDYWLSS
jgi:hypothetical protein